MSDALEIASLGRLLENGAIKLVARNGQLIARWHTARWIEPGPRKDEWRARAEALSQIEGRMSVLAPSWREDFEFIRSMAADPFDPRVLEALPMFRRLGIITGLVNRRNWNAAAGLGPKHVPQMASTATLTRDWIVRFRPNHGLRALFGDQELNLYEMASLLTECALPERLWLRFRAFAGTAPTTVITCENLGAYVDLPLPPGVMAVFSPGADVEAAAALLKALPDTRWVHFGDIDPDGLEIAESLGRETGRAVQFYVPLFAEEYLPGRPTETPWRGIPDRPIFHELKRTQKRIFHEVFMLDSRLSDDLVEMTKSGGGNIDRALPAGRG